MGWDLLAAAEPIADPVGSFKYVVFKNPNWDWTTLNFDSDVAALEKVFEPAVENDSGQAAGFMAEALTKKSVCTDPEPAAPWRGV